MSTRVFLAVDRSDQLDEFEVNIQEASDQAEKLS